MAKDRSRTPYEEREAENGDLSGREHGANKGKSKVEDGSGPGSESEDGSKRSEDRSRRSRSKKKRRSRRKYSDDDGSYSPSSYDDDSVSEDSGSDSESVSSEYSSEESGSEEERRRRKRRERKRREEREKVRRRKQRKEKERKRRRKEREEDKKRKRKKKKDKKKEKDKGKKGAVTNSWGKYGIIREIDMWNKRPEFTAWLAEVKQVNLESLPNWEEKQMFKEFMEDHNTATFPSKKYYGLDAYFGRKMEKEMKKGFKKFVDTERTVFNDEEQRRQELQQERAKQKEVQVEELKRTMQSGMAQAMKEQAQLKEEMAYQYKLGNFEAAAAIQRRLDPDVAM